MNTSTQVKAALINGQLDQAFTISTISSEYASYSGHVFQSFEEAIAKKTALEEEIGCWTEEEYYEGQGYTCAFEEIGWCKVGYAIFPLRFHQGEWEVFTCDMWQKTYFPT